VLGYLNQVSRKPDVNPQIFHNRGAMTMQNDEIVGWLMT